MLLLAFVDAGQDLFESAQLDAVAAVHVGNVRATRVSRKGAHFILRYVLDAFLYLAQLWPSLVDFAEPRILVKVDTPAVGTNHRLVLRQLMGRHVLGHVWPRLEGKIAARPTVRDACPLLQSFNLP